MGDRWSAETEELVERAQRAHWHGTDGWTAGGHSTDPDDCAACWEATDVALTALADAGVLMPVGGETRQEWGYRYRGFKHDWTRVVDMSCDEAVRCAEEFRVAYAGVKTAEAQVLRRTVHVGPWREVTDDPA